MLLGLCVVGHSLSPTTVLSTEEQNKIKDRLAKNIPGGDLPSTYYTVAALELLNAKVPLAEVNLVEMMPEWVYCSAWNVIAQQIALNGGIKKHNFENILILMFRYLTCDVVRVIKFRKLEVYRSI